MQKEVSNKDFKKSSNSTAQREESYTNIKKSSSTMQKEESYNKPRKTSSSKQQISSSTNKQKSSCKRQKESSSSTQKKYNSINSPIRTKQEKLVISNRSISKQSKATSLISSSIDQYGYKIATFQTEADICQKDDNSSEKEIKGSDQIKEQTLDSSRIYESERSEYTNRESFSNITEIEPIRESIQIVQYDSIPIIRDKSKPTTQTSKETYYKETQLDFKRESVPSVQSYIEYSRSSSKSSDFKNKASKMQKHES